MRLRQRFAFWFVLAAILPIGVGTWLTTKVITESYDRQASDRQQSARQTLDRLLKDEASRIEVLVSMLAKPSHPYLGGVLMDLNAGDGAFRPEARARQDALGRAWMLGFDLDFLVLTNAQGVVVDAPHHRPLQGERLSAEPGGSYRLAAALREGVMTNALVYTVTQKAGEGEGALYLSGGRHFDETTLAALRATREIDFRVRGMAGTELWVSAMGDWEKPTFSRDLLDQDSQPLATVEVFVKDERDVLLKSLWTRTAFVAAMAVLGTLLLAWWISRRMTRDLDRLVVGARAAAAGELNHQVPVRRRDEIGDVALALNVMMSDLKDNKERLVATERVAAWQEIAKRLAHEIKNPLTPIQMSIETMQRSFERKHPSFDELFKEASETILQEVGRLRRIVSEFAAFAKLPPLQKSEFELMALVKSLAQPYASSLRFHFKEVGESRVISADQDKMSQVIINLLENARDALGAQDDPQIWVAVDASDAGWVALSIEDNGTGLDSATAARVFTPYFTTKHAHGGSGLGLSIAHRIIAEHGGMISIQKGAQGGARFEIKIPAHSASA